MAAFFLGGTACSAGEALSHLATEVLVRIHFIIVMIRWTGLATWEYQGDLDSDGAALSLER